MMNTFRFFLISVAVGVAMAACGGKLTDGDMVDNAVQLCEDGDYNGSRLIVDALAGDSAALDTMSVGNLCRLAALCLRLDSVAAPGEEAGEAMAARCMVVARNHNADSVDVCLSSMPREDAMRLGVIDRVATYLVIPRDSLVVEGDTVPN